MFARMIRRMFQRNGHRTVGFTLVEVMIVIAIMAIMATIAAPSMRTFMAQRRLNGAARQIMTDLMAARMQAVRDNHKAQVFFYSGSGQYRICDDANGDNTVNDPEGAAVLRDIHPDYYDVTFTSNNNPVFSPNGTASNLATVTLSNSVGSKYVKVASTGRVRICDTAGCN